jgi:hypothetical protein
MMKTINLLTMKKAAISLMITILTITGCFAQKNTNEQAEASIVNFYRQYSSATDPGKYAYLYENLPDSLTELCSLIRSQFIHPYAELPKYREQIPKERWNEMFRYSSVKSILEGLVTYDSSGLTKERQPEDRLILGCWHNSILLASILKSRGIPARVRYGHATYIAPGYHISHGICEVWNEGEMRWMLVDPSMDMVDFSRDKFDISNKAWLQLQQKEIDPNLFGIPGKYSGPGSIVAKLCSDLASILGTEYTIFQYAPILDFMFEEDKDLTAEHIEILNRVSELMQSIDADNLAKLQEIYDSTPEIQITKTFNPVSANSENRTKPENN